MHEDQAVGDGFAACGCAEGAHCPLTLLVTFGALPRPYDTTSVRRVHVEPPLLTEMMLTLFVPAGMLP